MSSQVKAEEDSDDLTREADRVRKLFIETVGELDQRAQLALSIRAPLRRYATAGAFALLAGVVTYRIAYRHERRRKARVQMLRRIWMHPERVARPAATIAIAPLVVAASLLSRLRERVG